MNFKYVSMLACAALMAGFTSCSNDEDGGKSVNGEGVKARFSLKQASATRAASATPTDAEKEIYTAKVYIFDAGQRLEKVLEFTNSTTEMETTVSSGQHHFLAAVNYTDIAGMTEGTTTLAAARKIIRELTAASDILSASRPGYFMTNVEDISQNLASTEGTDAVVEVVIPVGRAMAKVNLACVGGDNATSLNGPQGKLVDVKYMTANNPKQMYNFPVLESGVYMTPFYAQDVANWMPVADQQAKYFPFVAFSDSYTAISGKSIAPDVQTYLIENSNETPRKHSAAYLLISGKFEPAAWVDADNKAASASADGTFYRLYNYNNDEYYDYYINATSAEAIVANLDKFAFKDLESGATINVIKYAEGKAYYAFYLKNKNNVAPTSQYSAKRNVFYDVTLDQVLSAGASVPNIEGNANGTDENGNPITKPGDYIPGTGGGDGGESNNNHGGGPDPIEGTSKIEGTITILPWTVVDQNGNIGF